MHRPRFVGAVFHISLFLQTPSRQFTQKPPSTHLFSALILFSTTLVMRFCFKKLYQATVPSVRDESTATFKADPKAFKQLLDTSFFFERCLRELSV